MFTTRFAALPALVLGSCCSSTPAPVTTPVTTPVTAAKVEPNEAGTLLAAWFDAFNREDLPTIMGLLTDDIVLIGSSACKGDPCIGKKSIEVGLAKPAIEVHFRALGVTITSTAGSRAKAVWAAKPPPEGRPRGIEVIRGSVTATARDGKLSRLVWEYDLTDPSTVLSRIYVAEVPFGFQPPNGSIAMSLPMRGLLSPGDHPEHTAVTIYMNEDTHADAGLVARVHHGTCANPGPVIHALAAFDDARSDTLIKNVQIADLLAEENIILIEDRGQQIACGQLPFALKNAPPWLPE